MKTIVILLISFLAAAAICHAQEPQQTPPIVDTPTPIPTVTPAKTSSSGTPHVVMADPSATPNPTPPLPEEIPDAFQPPIGDPQYGTRIEWRVFKPTDGAGAWPVIIVLHSGGFKTGSYYQGNGPAPQDLADAGFLVLVADYPLAPPNLVKGQHPHFNPDDPSSGRPPQQTNAVKALVNAAKQRPDCLSNEVGILGGSSGGSHAAFVSVDETESSVWPSWSSHARPNFVTCLSGGYDLSNRSSSDVTQHFVNDVENYTNTVSAWSTTSPYGQWNVSPVAHISSSTTLIPMYFVSAEEDSMPPSQMYWMWNAMTNVGLDMTNIRFWTIPGNTDHAFGYWNDPIGDTQPRMGGWLVKHRVIGFFKQYLPR